MLILSRKIGEGISIGDDIQIRILEINGGQVRVGIQAPPDITVHREEIYLKISEENRRAALETPADFSSLGTVFARGKEKLSIPMPAENKKPL